MSGENVSLRGSPTALYLPEAFAFRKQGKNIEKENILPTCPTNSQQCCLASSASPLPISPPSVSQRASCHSRQSASSPSGSPAKHKLQPASACSIQPASFPCGNSCWPQNRRSVWASQFLSCGQWRGRGRGGSHSMPSSWKKTWKMYCFEMILVSVLIPLFCSCFVLWFLYPW